MTVLEVLGSIGACALLAAACGPREGTRPPPADPGGGAGDRDTSAPSPAGGAERATILVQDSVVVYGRTAVAIEQHMIGDPRGRAVSYVDLEGVGQIVVYSDEPIECPGRILLTGAFFDLEGESKRGDGTPFVERQFDASAWECVAPGAAGDGETPAAGKARP